MQSLRVFSCRFPADAANRAEKTQPLIVLWRPGTSSWTSARPGLERFFPARPPRGRVMRYGPVAALAAVSAAFLSLIPAALAQPGEGCTVGREIVDDRGGPGTIVGGRGALCLVKYQEGCLQAWVPADQLRDPPEKPAAPEPGANPETP